MTPPIPTLRELLTARQFEVVAFLAKGLTDKEIAEYLGIADGTISHHVTEAMLKANVTKRTMLATRYAVELDRGYYVARPSACSRPALKSIR
jgi:DNA-binding NarL/FixJ family response regulator